MSARVKNLALITLLTSLASCSASVEATGRIGRTPGPRVQITYPPPPEEPRIQFLAAISSEGDLRRGRPEGKELGRPYGLGVTSDQIVVCVPEPATLVAMDLDTRDFEYQMPAGQGSLRSPTQCEPDAETGDLYVVDSRRGDVVVFDSLYNYVGNFQVPGGRAGDVALQGDSVWVSDAVDAKILIFDKATRTLARSIPEYARGADQGLMEPNNLAVTEDRVFVSNWGKFNVQVYDHDGEYLNTIGGYGRNWGQFVRNKGIAADREGRVYVVDAAFNNVQMFSQEGELLLSFGGPYTGLGGMYLPADVTISYDPVLLQRFQEHVLEGRELEYLIFVTNQYGPDQVNVYGFLKTQRPAS